MNKLCFFCLILVLPLALLAGCGREESEPDVTAPNPEAPLDSTLLASPLAYESYPTGWKLPFCGTWQISCGYGCGAHYDQSACTYKNYHAIDWNLPGRSDLGELVVAPASGWVRFSGWNGGYGVSVVVNAGGGYLYRVAHLKDENYFRVHAGEWIRQGDILGLCGETGHADGPHIHFSVHYPATYAGSGRICGPSVPQNGLSGHWDLRAGSWYDSHQSCQCQ